MLSNWEVAHTHRSDACQNISCNIHYDYNRMNKLVISDDSSPLFRCDNCQSVGQWLIVSDWRYLSYLRAFRACPVLKSRLHLPLNWHSVQLYFDGEEWVSFNDANLDFMKFVIIQAVSVTAFICFWTRVIWLFVKISLPPTCKKNHKRWKQITFLSRPPSWGIYRPNILLSNVIRKYLMSVLRATFNWFAFSNEVLKLFIVLRNPLKFKFDQIYDESKLCV